MRRDRQIINLYDKPLFPRPRLRPDSVDSCGTIVLCACLVVTLLATGFFFIYGTIAHPGPFYVPTMMAQPPDGQGSRLVAPEVPAPDMGSPEIAFANADVPEERRVPGFNPELAADAFKAPPKKKPKVHIAKRLPEEAAQAYAAAPDFFRIPSGGF
jgi:hypothetical protein